MLRGSIAAIGRGQDERRAINHWKWQENFGFVQANDVTGAQRMLICSGQTSVDENGTPVHAGDIVAQANKAVDNLETVLKQAGMDLSNVVRLNTYTTDVDAPFAAYSQFAARLSAGGTTKYASTLLRVARLAFPELMIEVEATAVGSAASRPGHARNEVAIGSSKSAGYDTNASYSLAS